jgi:hypothetical protein
MELTNICPMTLPRSDGPYSCAEKQCAWWTTSYRGTDYECSESNTGGI